MSSIRTQLNVGILLVLAIVFSAGGWAVERRIGKSLYETLDSNLVTLFVSEADGMLAQLRPDRSGRRGSFDGRGTEQLEGGEEKPDPGELRRPRGLGPPPRPAMIDPSKRQDFLFQLWHGSQALRSERLTTNLIPFARDAEVSSLTSLAPSAESFHTIKCETDAGPVTARALGVRFQPPTPDGRRLHRPPPVFDAVFAIDESNLRETLSTVRTVLVGAGLLGLVASTVALLFIARSSLSPLEELQRQLETLDASHPEARINLDRCVSELQPAIGQLNELLDRAQGEVQREKLFSSYVSHELRTPLTGLRLTMEMLLKRERDADQYRRGLQDCLQITRQMQELVLKLLEFARADRLTLDRGDVDVPALIEENWNVMKERAEKRGLSLRVADEGITLLQTDPGLFERVVANLLDNAVDYADEGSLIDVRLSSIADGMARLTFSNPSKNTRSEDGEHALDAFWRADEARTPGHHCGLGLSLTRRIIQQLGGHIGLQTESGHFTVEIELPERAPDP